MPSVSPPAAALCRPWKPVLDQHFNKTGSVKAELHLHLRRPRRQRVRRSGVGGRMRVPAASARTHHVSASAQTGGFYTPGTITEHRSEMVPWEKGVPSEPAPSVGGHCTTPAWHHTAPHPSCTALPARMRDMGHLLVSPGVTARARRVLSPPGKRDGAASHQPLLRAEKADEQSPP